MVEPSIEWTRQDGTVLNASSGYSLQLNFNPLMTSNISLYTCQAGVDITDIVSITGNASRLLAGKYSLCRYFYNSDYDAQIIKEMLITSLMPRLHGVRAWERG